MMVLQILIFSM